MFQIQWNLVEMLPMGQGCSTKNLKIFHQVLVKTGAFLGKKGQNYVNFQNHAKSPIKIEFSKIKSWGHWKNSF